LIFCTIHQIFYYLLLRLLLLLLLQAQRALRADAWHDGAGAG
jgi:hypothetical protein